MPTKSELERRVERLEKRQEDLIRTVEELASIAPLDMDDTPMALVDARTWKHPEMAIHIYEMAEQLIEESPNQVISRRKLKSAVVNEHNHTNSEVKATIKRLNDEDVFKEYNGRRLKIHPEYQDIDPQRLFKSNLTHADERRQFAAGKGKSVDNPDDKRDIK